MRKTAICTSLALASLSLSAPTLAGTMGGQAKSTVSSQYSPLSVTASLGYTKYQDAFRQDGRTPLGRLALGYDFANQSKWSYGAELGIQNGNTMRMAATQLQMDELGGLPIQTTIKPVIDLLATLRIGGHNDGDFFTHLKGGIALRQWQFNDRDSIDDKTQIAGEIQAGLGVQLNNRSALHLTYQGIFGGKPNFTTNPEAETGAVRTIPISNAVLLGVSVNI